MTDDAQDAVRKEVLTAHHDTVAAVCESGHRVAANWSDTTVSEPEQVTNPLADRMAESGLDAKLLGTLSTAAEAVDGAIAGTPVPAAPYFVVTSRGPLCRATLDDGRRLVLQFALFAVERRPRAYRFREPTPETCLEAVIRAG